MDNKMSSTLKIFSFTSSEKCSKCVSGYTRYHYSVMLTLNLIVVLMYRSNESFEAIK